MAIKWTEYGPHGTGVKRTWTTHEGLVVGDQYSQEDRVMSDVYATGYYCTVFNPETDSVETKCLGHAFELCSVYGNATVDAPMTLRLELEERQEKVDAAAKEAARLRAEKEAEERRLAEHNRPMHGKVMQVIRGRKVPKGTVGRVFWTGNGRVGLATSNRKDAHGRFADVAWVDAAYLANMAVLPA
jgi:hypothetical protein